MNPENLATPTPQFEHKKKSYWKSIIKEIFVFAVIAFGVVLPFRLYIAEPYVVDGRSMSPTFSTGDYLVVGKLGEGTPARNTVVVFNATNAGQPGKSFIKRIIGLPGETVIMKDNVVTIVNADNPNGFTLDQSYLINKCDSNSSGCISSTQMTLGTDEYFVMGDNRAESYDSRYWGPLQKKYVIGKPILRLLPVTEISVFPGADNKK